MRNRLSKEKHIKAVVKKAILGEGLSQRDTELFVRVCSGADLEYAGKYKVLLSNRGVVHICEVHVTHFLSGDLIGIREAHRDPLSHASIEKHTYVYPNVLGKTNLLYFLRPCKIQEVYA